MLFDIDEKEDIVLDNNGNTSIKKISFKKKVKIDNRQNYFNDIMKPFQLPEENEALLIKTNGLSDTSNIFRYILDNNECVELYLSTWIINRHNIDLLINSIKDNKIKSIHFVVSNRLKQLKKSEYAYLVEQFAKYENVKFKVVNCHAKTFSISTNNGYFTVNGSGNWTENPRIENYMITNDEEVFNFNKDWMKQLICHK